ncbi:hypothetical protein [Croceivirga thetidis]|uniref:Polysaccharide chain length determinant N-terminal domain-containing protein n=1 Tax=Croceivirga thetidis TaxID=2721623 RepID=A0ABX1GNG3_9FLAO|nr:hypothetical protein [Croceivirga thetidis]NKI31203.1 hypothetical protein [Croceivirga thetidis]
MSTSSNSGKSNDEVDLGQLFQAIGRGFQNLIDLLMKVVKVLANILIMFLLFLQKNIIALSIALVIGVVAGFVIDMLKTERYVSRMLVEPNFNSVQQLYNNVGFYNDLAEAEDSIALSDALNIKVGEAASIKKIFIDSYSDENQKIKLFDDFVRELDTSTVKVLDFESYLKNFNSLDARFHQISLVSTNSFVAKKAQPALIKSISANDYFKLQKRINDVNIEIQDSIINKQLIEIDSLQGLYKTILVKEAEKPMQGTNINLAENGESQNKELALIKEREILKTQLVRLNQERANKSSILNVISDFPNRGVAVKGFWNSYKFVVPLAAILLVILVLWLIQLNRYLNNHQLSTKVK